MKRRKLLAWTLLLVLAAILVGGVVAQAQTGGGYDLTWNVVGSGDMSSTGGTYSLGGTAGQAGAGSAQRWKLHAKRGFLESPHSAMAPTSR